MAPENILLLTRERYVANCSSSVLKIAIARGITISQIAWVLGVSRQRVRQVVHPLRKKRRLTTKPQRPLICAFCGSVLWLPSCQHHNRVYCSRRCFGAASHILSETDILYCIELRQSGHTWTLIAKIMKHSQQLCQAAIYRFLLERGQLNNHTLMSIWRHAGTGMGLSRAPSWAWLERKYKKTA